MSDLISRKALLSVIRNDRLTNASDAIYFITNAPAIEQGEAVGKVNRSRYMGDGTWFGIVDIDYEKVKAGDYLYTTPQQPQSVADALEEAALIAEKICFGRQTTDDAGSSRWLEAGKCGRQTADAIRALIKRNAKAVE